MQISDEMMQRATAAYMKQTGDEQHQLDGWFEPAMRVALEAALSVAEPVAWVDGQELRYLETVSSNNAWAGFERSIKVGGEKEGRSALYAAPPEPSLSVKTLADAYQKYLDAVNLYNERHAIMKTKALGSMRVDEEYKAIDETRRAFDKLAIEVATSGLSAQVQDVAVPVAEIVEAKTPAAQLIYGFDVRFFNALRGLPIGTKLYAAPQVQDVAGWQLVPKHPTDEMIAAAYVLGEASAEGIDEMWADMLAVAPAKQEGGE